MGVKKTERKGRRRQENCAVPPGPKRAVARTSNKSVQQRARASAPRVKFERHRTGSISEIVNLLLVWVGIALRASNGQVLSAHTDTHALSCAVSGRKKSF